MPSKIRCLASAIVSVCSARRIALDPEHLLLERAAVVEREDVELAVVAESHGSYLVIRPRLYRRLRRSASGYDARGGAPFHGPPLHDRDRRGAHDRRSRRRSTWPARSRGCSRRSKTLETEGEVKPELMESVCEIATEPCRNTREAGDQLRALRRRVQQAAARARAGDRLGRHASVRDVGGPADRVAAALPRPDRRPPVRGPPGDHLRHPRARGPRRPRQGRSTWPTACACTCRSCSRCRRTRPSGAASRPASSPPARRSSAPSRASGIPPRYEDFEDWAGAHRVHGRQQGHPRLHLPLVRRAPAPELRHGRDPGDGLPDARGAHARARRARSRRWSRSWPSTTRRARSCRATRTRCSTRTSGWPRATGSRASSSTCPRRDRVPAPELARRLMDRLRPHAEELGLGRGVRRPRGHPRQRHRRARGSARLRGQPRSSRGRARDRRGHACPRPPRRLGELTHRGRVL